MELREWCFVKETKNIVDTADKEKYDFADIGKPNWEHNVYLSNLFITMVLCPPYDWSESSNRLK